MSSKEKLKEVVIVGAGFSGLTLAYQLVRRNIPVQIYEKSMDVGGVIQTHRFPEMRVETAANGLLLNQQVHELFKDLNLAYEKPLPTAKKRFIYNGHLTRWPLSFFQSLGFLFRILRIVLLGRKKIAPSPGQTVHQWGIRHLGSAFTDSVLNVALLGIYASESKFLSASLVLGRFFKTQDGNKTYRGLVAPVGGMSELMKKLKLFLQEKNVKFVNEEVTTVHSISSPVVLATSFHEARDFFKQLQISTDSLKEIPLAKVAVTFHQPKVQINGFGALIDRRTQLQSLGVLANTMIFSDSGSQYSESWIIGFKSEQDLISKTDDEILSLIQEERKILLNDDSRIATSSLSRWPKALPLYDLQLEKWNQDLAAKKIVNSQNQRVFFTGNYLGHLGLAQIYKYNIQLAETIEKELQHASS